MEEFYTVKESEFEFIFGAELDSCWNDHYKI